MIESKNDDYSIYPIWVYFARKVGFQTCFIGDDFFDDTNPTGICVKPGYKILEKESLKYSEGKKEDDIFRGIRAVVETPEENDFVIYNVHLNPFNLEGNESQASFVANLIKQDIQDGYDVILTGDFNNSFTTDKFFVPASLTQLDFRHNSIAWHWFSSDILDVGWSGMIDQMWSSEKVKFSPNNIEKYSERLLPVKDLIPQASDHAPEVSDIYIIEPLFFVCKINLRVCSQRDENYAYTRQACISSISSQG